MTSAIRRAGFVILGKLSTSELGAMPVTEPLTHHPTRLEAELKWAARHVRAAYR